MNPFSRSDLRRLGFLSLVISIASLLSVPAFAWQGTTQVAQALPQRLPAKLQPHLPPRNAKQPRA